MSDAPGENAAVTDDRPLVTFLYLLGRDELPLGAVEAVMARVGNQPCVYSNAQLLAWARDVAGRLEGGGA